ncbi:hypothetical protein ABPG77_008585 [Micractinium sp. CCAP 211/92]
MSVLSFLSLLLLTSSARAQECSDVVGALSITPEVSQIVSLIEGYDLLPDGVPKGAAIFLPDNSAMRDLLDDLYYLLGFGNATNAIMEVPPDVLLGALDTAAPKLRSVLLYHFAPGAAGTPEELAAVGIIPTAFKGYTLMFQADNSTDGYAVTAASGAVANVLDDPVSACGSQLYLVDRVLLPASLAEIPDTPHGTTINSLGASSTSAAAPSLAP